MIKPRSEWDREDLLDYLDGWHQESGLGFSPEREGDRATSWPDPADAVQAVSEERRQMRLGHPAWFIRDAGRADRIAHREATGI